MRHTLAFCAAALIAVAASAALGNGWPALELFVVAAAVILLGVPHGALDVLHAARSLRIASPSRWLLFTAGYVAVAAAVVVAVRNLAMKNMVSMALNSQQRKLSTMYN